MRDIYQVIDSTGKVVREFDSSTLGVTIHTANTCALQLGPGHSVRTIKR